MDQVFINDSAGNHKLPITHFNSVRDSQGNTLTSVLGAVEDSVNEERAYVPADYSGMGRVVLKKNIKTISEVEANYLEQSMLTATNTVYVIKYDYTLATDITIPANCVLEFDGGSINGNYTLTGNYTGINAGLVKIFNTNVILAGYWNVTEAYPEWFGAKGDGITDDIVAITKAITYFYNIVLTNTYIVSDTIIINEHKKSIYSHHSGCIKPSLNKTVFDIRYSNHLHDFTIDCTSVNYSVPAIKISKAEHDYSKRTLISNISIKKSLLPIEYTSVGILLEDASEIGVYAVSIENCVIRNFAIGCHFLASDGYIGSNVISNIFFEGCITAVKMTTVASDSMVIGNEITDCSFQNNPGAEYANPINAIDCNGVNIMNNSIDIFLWDMDPVPNTTGSCLGNIGKNKYLTKPSYFYLTPGNYLFLGATAIGDSRFGPSPFGVKLLTDSCIFEILVLHNSGTSFDIKTCQYTPSGGIISVSFSPKLYYRIINDTVYYYLKPGTGSNFYLQLMDGISAIISNIEVPANRGNELTELFTLVRTIGDTSNRIDPPLYTLSGFEYYDLTLHKPYYRDEGNSTGIARWVDSNGNTVE